MNGAIHVSVPHSKCISQCPKHDAALDKVVEFQALSRQSVETHDDHLTELRGNSESHLVVGSVELVDVDVARAITVVAIKDALPLVDVLPELREFLDVDRAIVVLVEYSCMREREREGGREERERVRESERESK